MAVFNEPTKWQTSLVNSGDANTIPQNTPAGTGKASFKDGFPLITQIPLSAGGVAPDRKDFNGLFKVLGDWIFYAQNGGLPTYSADFDYIVGRYVVYNGTLYKCIQANGASSTVVAPDSNTAYWQRVALNNDLENYLPLVGGNITGNLTVQNKRVALNNDLENYLPLVGGNITGNLTVQNKNLVRSVNGVNADASGNVNVPRPVVDYSSGIDIAYRHASAGTFPRVTIPQDGLMVLYGRSDKPVTEEAYVILRIMNGDTVIFSQASNQPINANNQLFASVNLPVRKGQQVECAITGNTERICRLYPYIME